MTTPARTPAAPTTSTSPTGSPTSSCAGSRPTSSGASIDPDEVPELPDLWGAAFEAAYAAAERDGRFVRQVSARELYGKMMRTLAQTGNGWMTFKDASNRTCNQTSDEQARRTGRPPVQPLHRDHRGVERRPRPPSATSGRSTWPSTSPADRDGMDWDELRATVRTAVTYLDRVIDINYYPSEQAAASNPRWRPVGLGVMGLQDVFFALRLPFDSAEARELSTRIAEEVYLSALERSLRAGGRARRAPGIRADPRSARGPPARPVGGHPDPDRAVGRPARRRRRARAAQLLLVAIAPTATIASIAGAYECIEPQVSNLFKRETLSGEFLQVNTALVRELKDARAVERRGAGGDQAQRGLGAGHRSSCPRTCGRCSGRRGSCRSASLIDLAAARQPYIDQSQCLNLFLAAPTIGKLSSMYLYAWKAGLKSTYYLRSRPASRIQQATVGGGGPSRRPLPRRSRRVTDEAAIACSLENPETCEACE